MTLRILWFGAIFVCVCSITFSGAPLGNGLHLGPFQGRNMHISQLPWFSFPAERAAPLPLGSLNIRSGIYVLNEFLSHALTQEQQNMGNLPVKDFTLADYESTILELGVDWQILQRLRFSVDWRLHGRYGGFSDAPIEWWHNVFGFTNGNREFFGQNQSYWKVETITGDTFSGSGVVINTGDLDLRAHWTTFRRSSFQFALSTGFKIPMGSRKMGFGSGYPDLALAFVLDWTPLKWWGLYASAGIIFPLGGEASIMLQFAPTMEFRLAQSVSLIMQMNIQSTPIISTVQFFHVDYGLKRFFEMPQTNLKMGFKGQIKRWGWQVYIEEDPFTLEGPDILMYLGISYSLNLRKMETREISFPPNAIGLCFE